MSFAASYDRATTIISTVVCLGLLAVILAVHNIILICLSIFVILLCFAYSPRGYLLADRSILVKRLAGAARIPLEDVREARRATSTISAAPFAWAAAAGFLDITAYLA